MESDDEDDLIIQHEEDDDGENDDGEEDQGGVPFPVEPLFEAIRAGDEARLAELLEAAQDEDLDAIVEVGEQGLLHVAAREGHMAIVQLLVDVGLDFERPNGAGKTPLHIAAWRGHREVVALLLEAGADALGVTSQGGSVLFTAVKYRHVEVVRLLLDSVEDKHAMAEVICQQSYDALCHAVAEGYAEMCELLVGEGGACLLQPDGSRKLIERAQGEGHRDCAALLQVSARSLLPSRTRMWLTFSFWC